LGDIPLLATHFLQLHAERHQRRPTGFSASGLAALQKHHWPGNVRELEHLVERLLVIEDETKPLDARCVEQALGGQDEESSLVLPLDQAVAAFERRLIVEALERARGVLAHAARDLGVDRTTLSKRCKRLGIIPNTMRSLG
jgi:DNA-binding NtrC family response regulator